MERKRFSVLFFIKRSKLLKNGEAPVRVRVTYDRLYVELQLKRSVKVPLWSQEKEKSTGKDRNSVELNHYIDALRVKFYQIYQDLELEGKIISARAIVNRYQGKDETFKTLYNVFKEHNDNCRKHTGLAFIDVYNLRPEHISEDGNGNLWIVKPREKTNNLCNIPLLSIPKQILEKYKDNPYCMDKGTLLPVPCNQKMNSYLKEIADLCGIKKNLTTHTARHSFASVIALANNVSLPNVAKMLGHSSTRMTQHYAKVLDQTILKDMQKVEIILSK